MFGARFDIAVDEDIREARNKNPPVKGKGIDPYTKLGLREELTPKKIMVEIIVSGKIKDLGIIGEDHPSC